MTFRTKLPSAKTSSGKRTNLARRSMSLDSLDALPAVPECRECGSQDWRKNSLDLLYHQGQQGKRKIRISCSRRKLSREKSFRVTRRQAYFPPRRKQKPRRKNSFEPSWVDSVGQKGDLFYVEPPRNDISTITAIPRLPKQPSPRPKEDNNNRDKPLQKIKGLIGLKKSEDRPTNGRTTVVSHGVTFQEEPTGLIRSILLYVDPLKNNFGRRSSLAESLLGIIPGRFRTKGDKVDVRIMVQGLVPDGEAMRSSQVKIGDWLMSINDDELDSDNLESVLSPLNEAQMVKLTLQKFCDEAYITPPIIRKNDEAEDLARFVSGEQSYNAQAALKQLQHSIMFLTLDNDSNDPRAKTDVLYQYPDYDSKLVEVRGMFITLCHVMKDVCQTTAHCSSVLIDNQLIHVGYAVDGSQVLVMALPANKVSLSRLNDLTGAVTRFLNYTYGSLTKAFCDESRRSDLDHFFTVLCQRMLLADDMTRYGFHGNGYCAVMEECGGGVRWLWLPEELKVEIHCGLNELESADFGEMSDDCYLMRRQYTILGTTLFYKGFLVANHLASEDLADISLYLRFYCLLALSEMELIGQIVIWREIFRAKRSDRTAEDELGYQEPDGRHFLLIVGMKHTLLCVLLEAGGCAERADGHPAPDPFYVDQVKATLLQFDTMDLGSRFKSRLAQSCPSLVSADWFFPSGKTVKDEQHQHQQQQQQQLLQQSRSRVPSSPRGKKSVPESILKKRSSPSSQKDRESDAESIQSLGALSSNSTPSLGRRFIRNPSLGSEESAGSGGSSSLFRNPRSRRMLPSAFDTSSLKQSLEDNSDPGIPVKLTCGSDNVLFHYVLLDRLEGVVIHPSTNQHSGDGASPSIGGATHTQVVQNFHACCTRLKACFRKTKERWKCESVEDDLSRADHCVERGVLFECRPANWTETKKQPPTITYWVVGRLFRRDERELYVCYHDSASQNMIDLAFKLCLGLVV